MENNSGQKQSVLSKRKSNSREENRSKKVGVSPLPGLTSADTFGLVACLAILSNRTSPSQALDLDKKTIVLPNLTPDLAKHYAMPVNSMFAETLYLSGLVSNVRSALLKSENIDDIRQKLASEGNSSDEKGSETKSWTLDLQNIDGSITDYLSQASVAKSDSQIELEIEVEDTYQTELERMQKSADKFLETMQKLFAEELEILIAKKSDEQNDDTVKPLTNEEIVLAQAEEGGFSAYGLLGLLGLGGGGGGGGGLLSAIGSGAVSRLLSGSAIDAYVSGATVWWDADSDGVLDDDEISTTTDSEGAYSLDGVGTGGQIVISGGVDIDTGATVSTMKVDVDSISDESGVTVTPITLLQAYGIDDALIHEILETDPNIDFHNYDPIEIIEAGGADTVEAARILLHAQQYFALVNALVALAEEQGYGHHDAIELVIDSIYEEEDHSNLVGDNGGSNAAIAELITIMFPEYGTETVTDPDDTNATITLAEYAASNIVSVNSVLADYIPDVDSTQVYVHSDEAKAAALISQDDLVANFRTIGQLDPTVNKEDIAAALSTHRDAASIRTDFLAVYKQNIEQQAKAGGAMITGVDNISIIASNTPTVILASEILSNDTNLGEGTLELKAVEPLFAPTDYTTLALAENKAEFVSDPVSYNGFVETEVINSVGPQGESVTTTDYSYHFDISHVPDQLNGFVKISIDQFVIVMQRTDLAIDLVDQFKEALAQAHPRAPQIYEIEASPTDSDHFYVKHRDGSKINSEEDGSHGPVIKATGPYALSDGTDLIVGINDAGNVQVTASESAIEELKLNYIAANQNNQGHGVIKLSLEPTFQEIALSDTAITQSDEDGNILLATQLDYTETSNSAITESLFIKLDGIEQTGFVLNDTDTNGNTITQELVLYSSGVYSYPYIQIADLDTAFISTPTNFNGDINLNYKLVSTAGSGKFANISEITDQSVTIVPISESGDDAGTIVMSDTIDASQTSLESGILSVVENLADAKTKYFSVSGGDLSETRTIQLSNLPDGISVYIDGALTSVNGGKVSFTADNNASTAVSFTGSQALIQSQFGLYEDTKAVIISQDTGVTASTGNSVSFSLDIGGAYGLDVAKAVVAAPIEGDTVALGLQVNAVGENADLEVVIDISSTNLTEIQNTIELGTLNSGSFSSIGNLISELSNLSNPVVLNQTSEDLIVDGASIKRFTLDLGVGSVSDPSEALSKLNTLVIDPGDSNFKSALGVSINVRALDSNEVELASISSPITFSHDYIPEADGVLFSIPTEDLDFTDGLEDQSLSLQKLFDGNATKIDDEEIVYFRLYDLSSLGLSVVDSSGSSLGRVVDSEGTIELSQTDALNAFVSLKSDADLPTSSFYVKAFSREPTGEISELVPAETGEFAATIKIAADADAPILSMDTKVRGLVNDSIPDEFTDKAFIKIPATAALDDTDGSESLFIKVSVPLLDNNGASGSVYDFSYSINGNTFFSEESGVVNASLTTDGNYRYGSDISFFNDGTDNFFLIKAVDLNNLQISRPSTDGAFEADFTVEAVSVDRGFETANTPFTTELSLINAAKVVNGDDTSMDFASDGTNKSLTVEFLQPATKPAFTFTHTDAANNKFTLDFTNHDGTSTDLVSILVTGATGATFSNSAGNTIGAPADVDGVFVFSMDEFYQDADFTTLDEITLSSSASLPNVTFQAFSVDKIGITNQSSDDSFAADFVSTNTGDTALADPIVIDIDGDGLSFTQSVNFDIDADGDRDSVGWVAANSANDGFVVLLDVDANGTPIQTSGSIQIDGSNLITEYFDGYGQVSGEGNPNTDAFNDLLSISNNGLLQLSDLETFTGKKAFLWFDEASDGLGNASFDELAKITSLEIDLNRYSETNTQQDNILIAGNTSSGAISGNFTHLDSTGNLSTDVGAFTANSSMFDIWLPVNSSSTLTGTMSSVTLGNNIGADTTYFEDEENGFDLSSVFSEVNTNWASEFNLGEGESLPENILVAVRAKHAGTYFNLSQGARLEGEPTETWLTIWNGDTSAPTEILERLRIFTRDDFSGDLELEISATALIDPLTGDTRTVNREVNIQVEAVADRLEVNVSGVAEEGTESVNPVTITFDEFSVQKTDVGENVEVIIQSADVNSVYPDLILTLNGQDYTLSSGGSVTLPYPIYSGDLSVTVPGYLSGDFKLKATAKSIDGDSESVIDDIPLNFSVTAVSQGSDVSVDAASSIITEATRLVPVNVSIIPRDTDGSEEVGAVTLYVSANDLNSAPAFISEAGDTINFTAYSDSTFNGYRLELDEEFYQITTINGVNTVSVSGNIQTPQYFDGEITLKAEAVTLEIDDTSKSQINEASQTFTIEGISDGIDAENFSVAGTAIYGSQSITLSSIIKSISTIDADEEIQLNLSLSSEFSEVLSSSGFYNNSTGQYLSDPLILSGTNSEITSLLTDIEIRTVDNQSSFSLTATGASRDGTDSLSTSISRDIFISSTPLSIPELVTSDGSPFVSSLTLIEGQSTTFDIAASVNGRINPDNIDIEFIGIPDGFQITPIGGTSLIVSNGVLSVNAGELTQGVIIGPDPNNAAALNRSQDINFSVLPKATYYDDNNNLLAEKFPIDGDGNSLPTSFFIDVIPALDGVTFTSDLLVNGNELNISDIITLQDPGNEELLEVKLPANNFLEVRLVGSSDFISFDTELTLTREQLSSGTDVAVFRKSGNFVGTSDLLIEATTVSIGEDDVANGITQSSNVGFEFNTDADLVQIYETSTSTEILDDALINDGRTDTGENVEFNISISAFSSVNSADTVGVVLSGSAIVEGSEITIATNTITAQQIGNTSSYQIFIPGDGNSFTSIDKAQIALSKTELGFGARALTAKAVIANKANISTQSLETETIDIQSDTPPVANIGFDTDLLDTELSASSLISNGLKITDIVRIPEMNANHVLELVSLPDNVSIEVAGSSIPNSQLFEINTNTNPEAIFGVRLSSADLETAVIKLSNDVALGSENLEFKTRVGIPDGINVEAAETRYSYSRFVEFNYNFAVAHGLDNNLIIDNTVTDIDAGGGNDIIIPVNGSSGSINGGEGNDTLTLTNAVSAGGKAIVDLNAGSVYLSSPNGSSSNSAASNRDIASIENVVGTSGDDTFIAKGGQTSSVTFSGKGGDDYLVGGAGDDYLIGGTGDDIITGSEGIDTIIISVSDENGERDAGTDIITDFNPNDVITFSGFGITKSQDGSLPSEVLISKNAVSGNYEISVQKETGTSTLTSLVIIEDIGLLSTDEQTAITQIRDAIVFDETIDVTSANPFNSVFDFGFEESIIDLASSEASRETFFGDDFAYDDIGNALGIIADAKFDYAYKSQIGALNINVPAGGEKIDLASSTDTYVGLSGSKNDDTLVAKDTDSVLFGGTGSDRLIGGLGDDTLIATGGSAGDEDYLLGGAGSDNFVLINPAEINETLEKIYQVRFEDFNRFEGDRVTLVGYDNHEISLSDVDENNIQTAQISGADPLQESLTIYFDLSFVREFDAAFNLRMADFDKVDAG